MNPTTFEATVIDGQIRLPAELMLPENAQLFVTIADSSQAISRRIASPRLADSRLAGDFAMESLESPAASL